MKPEFLNGYSPVPGKLTVLYTVKIVCAPLKHILSKVRVTLFTAKDKPVAAVLGVFNNYMPVLRISVTVNIFKRDYPIIMPRLFRWSAVSIPIIFVIVTSVTPLLALSVCSGRSR